VLISARFEYVLWSGGIAEGVEQLASHPNRFIHGDMNSVYQWIGGWVSRRFDVYVVEKKEVILCNE
jgi:hypothetical protein